MRSDSPETATLFVSIAAYRDPECAPTIRDLFNTAINPDRIAVGVCWQSYRSDDEDLVDNLERVEQVRCVRYDAHRSRGACWAKSQAQQLWRGERYVLNIDSHMRFAPGWDVELIRMLAKCRSPKPVLSTYPAPYQPPKQLMLKTPQMVPYQFHKFTGILLFRYIDCQIDAPKAGAFVSGNFSFASASFLEEIPYDSSLYFYGEEITMSVRAWSHGWDVFIPHQCVIHHYYRRPRTTPRHWTDHRDWLKLDRASVRRVHHLLGVRSSRSAAVTVGLSGRFGLGGVRGLDQFQDFAGVYFREQRITRRARRGEVAAQVGRA
jgi:hypothetical protein